MTNNAEMLESASLQKVLASGTRILASADEYQDPPPPPWLADTLKNSVPNYSTQDIRAISAAEHSCNVNCS